MVDLGAPKGGLDPATLHIPDPDQPKNYTRSKVGNWFLASEVARQVPRQGHPQRLAEPGESEGKYPSPRPSVFPLDLLAAAA